MTVHNTGERVECVRGSTNLGKQGTVVRVVTTERTYVEWDQGGSSAFADPTSLKALSQRVPLRGAAMHLWNSPDWKRELGLIADAGANVVRWDANWKVPDKHWNNGKAVLVTDFIAECRRLGLKSIVSFLTEGAGPADDVTRGEYAKSAAKFCQAYAGDLAGLEVFNEPNEPGPGAMSPASYAALVKATYPAVKAAAPSVPVLVGSTSRVHDAARTWLSQAINAGMPLADGLAVHPYSAKWPVSTVGTALDVDGLTALNSLFPSSPIYCTEFGASTVSQKVDPNYSVTETAQADKIWKAWQDVDTLPFVKAATLYNTVENGPDTIWGRWGVVHRDFTLKPGCAALKAGITR